MKKKVLVIKIGAIGDVIRSLTLLEHLKGSDITWVCGKIPSPFVKSTGLVSEIIEVDEKKLFQGSFFQKFFELFRVWKKIGFFKSFDKVIIAHSDWRYNLFSLFVNAKEKRKFKRTLGKANPISGRYFANEYARLVLDQNDFISAASNNSVIFPEIIYEESKMVRDLFAKNEKVVALAPGGANNILNPDNLRRYPIEKYVFLAEKLLSSGFKVFITGSRDDDWAAGYFANLPVENLIGKTSLLDLFAIYKRCDLVITHDAGPLHIATLAKTKVLGIFGPTEPRTVAGEAFLPHVNIIFGGEKLACAPCYDGKYFAKCKCNHCMQNISCEYVYERALKILQAN